MAQLKATAHKPPTQSSVTPILAAQGVIRTFRMGEQRFTVLQGVDLLVNAGEFIAIEGRSGSGKSTLLHLLGALDTVDAGSILYNGQDLARMTNAQRSAVRNTHFGFVFQFYHLLPELNVLENTMLASMIQRSWFAYRARRQEITEQAVAILTKLGLEHRLRHRTTVLSGGERQRVAIARALMNRPKVLFADEPTGNLDFDTGRQIMSVLESLHREQGQTVIMVTHDRGLARQADRLYVLTKGHLEQPGDKAPADKILPLDYHS